MHVLSALKNSVRAQLTCKQLTLWNHLNLYEDLHQMISVLLAFKDILFALGQAFRSFRSLLMCLFLFFNNLSDRIKLISPAK